MLQHVFTTQCEDSMAGFETSAQVIGYAIWQLAHHPEMQQQLREEVASISNPTFDEYTSKMPFLDAVIKERYFSLHCGLT